jgi:hypothetical protein
MKFDLSPPNTESDIELLGPCVDKRRDWKEPRRPKRMNHQRKIKWRKKKKKTQLPNPRLACIHTPPNAFMQSDTRNTYSLYLRLQFSCCWC